MLVRTGEWAESNQVFFQAGPSVPLELDGTGQRVSLQGTG